MAGHIVVVGSGGRLGAALKRCWIRQGERVTGLDRAAMDLADPLQIRAVLGSVLDGSKAAGSYAGPPVEGGDLREKLYPRIALEGSGKHASAPEDEDRGERQCLVVNCAALTDVDRCEREPELAMRINAEAPETMAEVCSRHGARLVHISTDYVFDGHQRALYREEDLAAPVSTYGVSKLAGEKAVLQSSEENWVARVSWVFGPDRPSFVDAILKRALEGQELSAVADKYASPTFTLDAARWLYALLWKTEAGGVIHLCNSGSCSWQEYGQHAIDCAVSAGVHLESKKVAPIRMADLKAFIARRPVYSAMDTSKLGQMTGLGVRSWQEAVEDYVRNSWAPAVGRR
jgi:dTDP-4-dehydrorhamnose reductase